MGLIRMILEKAMWKSEGKEEGMLDVDMLSEQLGLITLFWEKDGEDDRLAGGGGRSQYATEN